MIRFAILCVLCISARLGAAEEGFEPIFDGKTLDGWKTFDASYWTMKDGAITATITKEHPLRENRYLIWQGNAQAPQGQLADFELKLKSRVRGEGAINNGFQWLYHEHGRDTLAFRGERTTFDRNGKVKKEPIQESSGDPWFKLEEWHEYHLICIGHRLTLKVDDRLAAEVIDNDPKQFAAQGILGLQLHSGPPTVAQFKDIRLKIIQPAKP